MAGMTLRAKSSRALNSSTSPAGRAYSGPHSGNGVPVVTRAIQSAINVDLPVPASPTTTVKSPARIRPGQTQPWFSGCTGPNRLLGGTTLRSGYSRKASRVTQVPTGN